ncbi:MAG: ATP synthase F0 subunit A [Flavobacteriaceae bacterium]|nr:MAG: ATP synthase F0 subunit A [Flavobacteriaceae bacterium]
MSFPLKANPVEGKPTQEAHSQESGHHGGAVDSKEEVSEYIAHHVKDSHDFTLFADGEKGTHTGFHLPVILWDKQSGLKMFSSCLFDYENNVATVGGDSYRLHHGKIYKTDKAGNLTYDAKHGEHPTNQMPLDFSITKTVLGMLLTSLLLLLGFGSLARGYNANALPKGIGRFLEPLVIYVKEEIAIPNIGEKKYRKYMGYLLTVFFFVLLANLLGLTPLGLNITGNLAVTACLALITFLIVQFSGNKDYWKHIFWMPGVPVPLKILLAPIELFGIIVKPIALMLRLFANMTAGHIVVMALISIAFVAKQKLGTPMASGMSLFFTLFIMCLELLVAFLQAYIFTLLSALYIGTAVEEHDHH